MPQIASAPDGPDRPTSTTERREAGAPAGDDQPPSDAVPTPSSVPTSPSGSTPSSGFTPSSGSTPPAADPPSGAFPSAAAPHAGREQAGSVLERLGLARIEPPAVGRAPVAATDAAPSDTAPWPQGEHAGGRGHRRLPVSAGAVRAAALVAALGVAGLPALVLAWRAALAASPSGSSVVGGVLVVAGLAFLAVGGLTPAGASGPGPGHDGAGGVSRAHVLLAVVGVILLACAVAAVA